MNATDDLLERVETSWRNGDGASIRLRDLEEVFVTPARVDGVPWPQLSGAKAIYHQAVAQVCGISPSDWYFHNDAPEADRLFEDLAAGQDGEDRIEELLFEWVEGLPLGVHLALDDDLVLWIQTASLGSEFAPEEPSSDEELRNAIEGLLQDLSGRGPCLERRLIEYCEELFDDSGCRYVTEEHCVDNPCEYHQNPAAA